MWLTCHAQLISLLYDIGAVSQFLPEYRLLDVKNMLCDTFSWPLINLACGCGCLLALNQARDSLVIATGMHCVCTLTFIFRSNSLLKMISNIHRTPSLLSGRAASANSLKL
jgi:hypothetical protein